MIFHGKIHQKSSINGGISDGTKGLVPAQTPLGKTMASFRRSHAGVRRSWADGHGHVGVCLVVVQQPGNLKMGQFFGYFGRMNLG